MIRPTVPGAEPSPAGPAAPTLAPVSRTPAGLRLTTITDDTTGHDHLVDDEEFARGRTAAVFRYRAVCGGVVRPASLLRPPSGRCAGCMAWASRRWGSGPPRRDRARWLRRLLRGRIAR